MSAAGPRGEERELKLGIPDERALHALIERVGGRVDLPAVQENHFFDSPGFVLRDRRLGLRIRHEQGEFTLTLKGPSRSEGAGPLTVRAELEIALDAARAHAALEGALPITALLDLLEPLAIRTRQEALLESVRSAGREAPLHPIGSFRNTRTRVHTALDADGASVPVVLEFDRTEFAPGDVRCEVELELDDAMPQEALQHALERSFREVGVEPQPTSSKLGYFLERLSSAAPPRSTR
ncbi:MAG: CYTH domain-containing protein [Myxococcota bacterium]